MPVVSNPTIPYWAPIPGGLQIGKKILITGFIPCGAYRFFINFSRGSCKDSSDVALHVNVRFDERIVVRNSYVNSVWKNEERHQCTFPFCTNSEFEILFVVEHSCFKIFVDEEHYVDFVHRMPINTIDKLNIEGNVIIKKIEYIYETCQNLQPPSPFVLPRAHSPVLPPIYNPTLPFAQPLYGGLNPGMHIYVYGHPTACADRFQISLQTSVAPYPPPDIALYFNPDFAQNCVIRNSKINNCWGSEERHGYMFPFSRAATFDMVIRVEYDKFMLAVNGNHFVEFRHRVIPISRVNTLCIDGDVNISCVRFQSTFC